MHSGWATPIPYHFLTKYAPGFTLVYRDFLKQNHYKMEISERCKDPNIITVNGENATFKTKTYYPPGMNMQYSF